MDHADAGSELRLALGDRGLRARSVLTDLIAEAHQRGCSLEDLLQVDGLEARLDEHHIADALYTAECPIPTSSSAPPASSASPTSCYGRSPTPRYSSPTASGLTSRHPLLEAIQNYQKRERRFGGLGETFTDEGLDALEPAAEVAEEIVTELTPKQSPRGEAR